MNAITIKDVAKVATAWEKSIYFQYEGETHLATLYWDIHDGYDLVFKNTANQTPEWVIEWESSNNGSLASLLDALTEGEGE